MTNQEFINYVAPRIVEDSNKRNILPSPRIAQAILESGYGTSVLATKANALFGVKNNNQWEGKTYNVTTGEYYNAKYTEVSADFQAYDSWDDSIYWQGWYLENRKISTSAKKTVFGNIIGVRDYKTVCKLLKQDGYATGPEYDTQLIQIIEEKGLTKYDVMTIPVQADISTPVARMALTVGHSRLKNNTYTSADGRCYGGVLEYDYNKELAPLIAKWMKKANWEVDVIICPERVFSKSTEESTYKLSRVNVAGKYDLVCELHLNATPSHNGSGAEVLYVSNAGKVYAQRVINKLSKLINKHGTGLSLRNNLYMLTKTKPVSIMLETFFCDNQLDCNKMTDKDAVAKAIAEGIVGHDIDYKDKPIASTPQTPVKDTSSDVKYWIQVGAFKVKANAVNQVNKLKVAGISSFVKGLNGFYVVQAGAYNVKQAAITQLEYIKKKGFDAILVENK